MPKQRKKTQFDQGVENFGEEVGALGKKMEKKGNKCCAWYRNTFGVAGPLISAIFWLVCLTFGIWALKFLVLSTGAVPLAGTYDFFLGNIGIFFLIILLSSYLSYFRSVSPKAYAVVSPLSAAFDITVFLWVAANIVQIINIGLKNDVLLTGADYALSNLAAIFILFAFLGYFVLFLGLVFGGLGRASEKVSATGRPARSNAGPMPRRIYRSGKDKILGGVCGGIAEYLHVDPVIIRLIWAVSILFYGTGFALYIIAWIIIPRNPNHKWD